MGLRDRLTIVLFILLMLSKGAVWAADEFKIIRISPEGGFAFDAINAISEDKFGFIWFGTNSGVYRYNTVETAKFINLPDDKSSIPGNNIRSIYRDQKGDIWISTNNGLCQFDYQCECFNRMALHDLAGNQRGTSVYQVLQSSDGHFWMIDNSGFGSFDPIAGVANNLPMPDSRKNETIRVAAIDQEGKRIWLGGLNGGIYSCDPPYREIKFHAATRDVSVIALLPGDKLWVGYDWGGTDLFSASGTLMEHYSDDVQGKNRIPSSRVRAIFRNKDEIWIGSFKGLVRLKGDQINVIEKEKYPGLLNNSIFQFFRDSKNGIWIGTWSGGLSYINEWTNSFEHYKREPYGNSLSDNVVSDFEETPDRKIIIATEEGHLNFLDPVTRKIDVAYINSPSGLVNHIKSLHTDPNGTLWVGTFASGIFYRSRGSESFRHFDLISNSKEQFYDITSDKDGVWFASSLRGLYHYSFHTQTVTQYMPVNSDPESISSTMVRSLLFDSSGNLWVGTNGGLNLMRKNTEKFVRYFYNPERKNRISSNVIYSLLEDSKKNIWIGTAGGGVNIFDPATATFSQLSKAEGLAGNDVYGIQEDDTGTIWMSTENGISAYSPATREFRNFDFTDGLQSNQFNPGSVFKSSNGELYFGGSNGFNRFDPKKMKMNPIAPKAYITGLEINNLDVSHVTDPDLIPQSLLTVDKLVLKHNQNSLRFEFVANNL
ncbi:MAG: hypothetical protein LWW85_14050, partial [Marinilabiliales bacterium]|nr:hypothetical protein [Marinilabiliales bacterium]